MFTSQQNPRPVHNNRPLPSFDTTIISISSQRDMKLIMSPSHHHAKVFHSNSIDRNHGIVIKQHHDGSTDDTAEDEGSSSAPAPTSTSSASSSSVSSSTSTVKETARITKGDDASMIDDARGDFNYLMEQNNNRQRNQQQQQQKVIVEGEEEQDSWANSCNKSGDSSIHVHSKIDNKDNDENINSNENNNNDNNNENNNNNNDTLQQQQQQQQQQHTNKQQHPSPQKKKQQHPWQKRRNDMRIISCAEKCDTMLMSPCRGKRNNGASISVGNATSTSSRGSSSNDSLDIMTTASTTATRTTIHHRNNNNNTAANVGAHYLKHNKGAKNVKYSTTASSNASISTHNYRRNYNRSNNSNISINPNNSNDNNNNINTTSYNTTNISKPPNRTTVGTTITPLHQIPYVHGGYAAAAPLFVTHSKFAFILKRLLPNAYSELSCLLRQGAAGKHSSTKGSGGSHGQLSKNESAGNGGSGAVSSFSPLNHRYRNDDRHRNYQGTNTNTNYYNNNHYPQHNRHSHEQRDPNNELVLDEPTPSSTTTAPLPDPVKIMKWAENNPVVSAFGIWESDAGRRTKKFMEGVSLSCTNSSTFGMGMEEEDDGDGKEGTTSDGGETEENGDNDDDDVQLNELNEFSLNRHNKKEGGHFFGGNASFGGSDYSVGDTENLDNAEAPPRAAVATSIVVSVENNKSHVESRHKSLPPLPPATMSNTNDDLSSSPKTQWQYPEEPKQKHHPLRRKHPPPTEQYYNTTNSTAGSMLYQTTEVASSFANYTTSRYTNSPSYKKPAIEWDVFLDPKMVRQVDKAMTVVDDLNYKLRKVRLQRHKKKRNIDLFKNAKSNGSSAEANAFSNHNNNNDDDNDDEDNEDDDLLEAHTAAQVEVDRLVSHLMKRTILAHGSMSQLVLEAFGVAPEYNFGTVVKSSREEVNPINRFARANSSSIQGLGLAMSQTWDEEEEQRDFEALLDPKLMKSGKGGTSKNASEGTTNSSSSVAGQSKGMFMETWIHLFSQTLKLLEKTNSDSAISKKISLSSSSSSGRRKQRNDHGNTANRDNLSSLTKPAQIGQQSGLGYLLGKMFLTRKDSSFRDPKTKYSIEEADEGDDDNYDGGSHNGGNAQDEEDDDSITDDNSLTHNDMFSSTAGGGSSSSSMCGIFLCLGMGDDSDSFPREKHNMAQDIQLISDILDEPLRLVLDLKSRRVPPRVWSRLIDNMRSRGLMVEGIGSFDIDELRVIGKGCSCPLTPLLFFHSVGDLQRACHANEVKKGDTVYFNGGSLMWKRPSIMESAEIRCCGVIEADIDDAYRQSDAPNATRSPRSNGHYSFQPYAYPRSALSDWERVMCKATIEDYQRHFNLKIGVYVQEFSISPEALDALSCFVNKYSNIYDLGLAFGGVNGTAVKNVEGDGYWNQRYISRSYDFDARPSKTMTPLKPEDHHMVQKAIQAGAWGQVGTIYEVMDEKSGALTVPAHKEPCNLVGDF